MTSIIFSNKKLPLLLHILAWVIIIIIPGFLVNVYGGDFHFLWQFYTHTAILGVIFYINYLCLVPHFFFRSNKLLYFIVAAILIVLLYFVFKYINDNILHDPERERQVQKLMNELDKSGIDMKPPIPQFKVYNYFLSAILILGFSLGLTIFQKLTQNEKERKELEKEKLNSELAFLKNQVSPHFFFNTLNNIYSLIGIDASEAQNSVLKLSKLMRYLLYESEHGETKLQDEINFMNHYIDLMKLRLTDKVKLTVSFPENTGDQTIVPLLFVPFIENAFKHGISYREPSFIDIKMKIDNNNIFFYSKNSIGTSSHANDGQHSGIGLENVKKRLLLLFPDAHKLTIENTPNTFSIELQLKIKDKAV